MRVRVATRRSNLAMEQTREVLSVLEELGHQWEIVGLDSHGDVDRKTPLHKMSRTGIFVELLNHLVASGEADIAVHSAKDMPSSLEPGLVVCHTPPRGPWWDVMVTDSGIDGLGPGSRIGTSSIRRQKALSLWRPDLVAQDLRGNVDTRISRMRSGEVSGLILAEAGLQRLGIDAVRHRLPDSIFVPQPNQGIIAVVARAGSQISGELAPLSHSETMECFRFERQVSGRLRLGCSVPAGILVRPDGRRYTVEARFFSMHSSESVHFLEKFSDSGELEEISGAIAASIPPGYGYRVG
ncbi:hydroxymethylbilane synthase [Thermogymnomonas acidicola]|uniref:Hydroxymethylbilane synthase n=1 Tax=Thermogymnomonas acidicola TaxID=399579 RepID=A0AA37BR33_9ARCH|nr:hydroxymethylbilane synthase [Thermogymnomonas acidicola]GGM72311.1 hydroxymethylbilane synthase [Thermogymnomonas acidicola]